LIQINKEGIFNVDVEYSFMKNVPCLLFIFSQQDSSQKVIGGVFLN